MILATPYQWYAIDKEDAGCSAAVHDRREGPGGLQLWICVVVESVAGCTLADIVYHRFTALAGKCVCLRAYDLGVAPRAYLKMEDEFRTAADNK